MDFKVFNNCEDYCEISYGEFLDKNTCHGFIHVENTVDHMDYENDKIAYVDRWYVYVYTGTTSGLNGCSRFGRETGYATKKEAIKALKKGLKRYCQPND